MFQYIQQRRATKIRKFISEFKEFAMKGNVMDMAVSIIIGSAFTGIVTSLVDNILSPVIGLLTKGNFDGLAVDFFGVTLKYGSFIMAVINFLIVAFVLFVIIKAMNKAKSLGQKQEEEAEPEVKECPYCMSEIPVKATRCPHCTSQL